MSEVAAPSSEISNQFLKELIRFKKLLHKAYIVSLELITNML